MHRNPTYNLWLYSFFHIWLLTNLVSILRLHKHRLLKVGIVIVLLEINEGILRMIYQVLLVLIDVLLVS